MNKNPQIPPVMAIKPGSIPDQAFKGIARPSDNFVAIANDLRSPPIGYLLDLTNARSIGAGTAIVLNVAGNSFYVDGAADVGNASVHFQDTKYNVQQPPIFVGPQFIARVPFTRIIFENTAQPGLFLRFFYGVDIDFVPGLSQAIATIGTITNPVKILDSSGDSIFALLASEAFTSAMRAIVTRDTGFNYGATFGSTALPGANTPENIIAAASNLNGYMLWDFGASTIVAGGDDTSFLAKATAPATIFDGDIMSMIHAGNAVATDRPIPPQKSRFVSSGKRLDFISVLATAATSKRFAVYTILS